MSKRYLIIREQDCTMCEKANAIAGKYIVRVQAYTGKWTVMECQHCKGSGRERVEVDLAKALKDIGQMGEGGA